MQSKRQGKRPTLAEERASNERYLTLLHTLYVENGDWVFLCKCVGGVLVARKWWLSRPRYWLETGPAANV